MEVQLNTALFIGIDAHPSEHTAVVINRFEEEKGSLRFENTTDGITQFLTWITPLVGESTQAIFGIEGGTTARHALIGSLLNTFDQVYEVNPLFTKQRRMLGTRNGKSDPADAKLIAEVLTKKLDVLPKLSMEEMNPKRLCLKKAVWYYERLSVQRAQGKNVLHQLTREYDLARSPEEKRLLGFLIKEKEQEKTRILKAQKKLKVNLASLLKAEGENLLSMKGIDIILAARIIAHANGIARFRSLDKFIKYAGIAPVERSSGKNKRHVRNTRGNRQLNSTFHLVALNQLRWNEKAKSYFEKKVAEGKTKRHALRCLTKRSACIVYGLLKSGKAYQA
jgi:transposase